MRLALWLAGAALPFLVGCGTTQSSMSMPTDARSPGPCQTFEDHSGAGDDRTVSFGGQNGSGPFSYAPQCMQIAKGQSVSFSGDFSVHPLGPGSPPGETKYGSTGNPIHAVTGGQKTQSFQFSSSGLYPYYCMVHYAGGMVGAVEVR